MFFHFLSKLFKKREEGAGPKDDGEVVKPFLDHLEDLRWTIVKIVVTLFIGMVASFVFATDLVKVLQWPIHWAGISVAGSAIKPATPPTDPKKVEASPEAPKIATVNLVERMSAKGLLSKEEADVIISQAKQEFAVMRALDSAAAANKVEIRSPSPFNAIMSAIQISFYAAITLCMPLLLYFLGEFVMPALTAAEKRYIIPALAVGFILFLGGVLFSFTQVMPGMLKFLHAYTVKMEVQDMWDLKTYCAFVAHLCIAFGLLCELPVVVITLNFLGLVGYKTLASTRAYALTGILVLCAVVSPSPDLATLFMLAAPIAGLYELCIWIVWYLDRRRAKAERDQDKDDNNKLEPID